MLRLRIDKTSRYSLLLFLDGIAENNGPYREAHVDALGYHKSADKCLRPLSLLHRRYRDESACDCKRGKRYGHNPRRMQVPEEDARDDGSECAGYCRWNVTGRGEQRAASSDLLKKLPRTVEPDTE